MFQKYTKQFQGKRAFTLVELMVTVVVIIILASIITFAALAQQKTSRDAARNAKTVLIAEALEKYYDKNNEYPSVASLANQPIGIVKQKLNIKDDETLVLPLAATSATPIVRDNPSTTQVAYIASTKDPGINDQCQNLANGYCDKFTLQYKKESDNSIVNIKSRRDEFIASADRCDGPCPAAPGQPTVMNLYVSNTDLRFIAGATCPAGSVQYKVRYNTSSATEASMPSWSTLSWTKNPMRQINPGGYKVFHYQAIARCVDGPYASVSSPPSAIGSVDISPPGKPTVYANTLSAFSIQISWTSVPGATSYSVSGLGNASSCTSSPCTISGLSPSTYYNFTVRAYNKYGGGSPGVAGAQTLDVPATPAGPGYVWVSDQSGTATRWNWYGVACNLGTPEYALRLYKPGYGNDAATWTTTWTTTVPDTSSEGHVYALLVKARCVDSSTGLVSGWSGETRNGCTGGQGGFYLTGPDCDFYRPMGVRYIRTGWSAIVKNGLYRYGQSRITGYDACPSGSNMLLTYDVKVNDGAQFYGSDAYWSAGTSTYNGYSYAIGVGQKVEFQWHARCNNPTTGKESSPWHYADVFGNVYLKADLNSTRWSINCGGGAEDPVPPGGRVAENPYWCQSNDNRVVADIIY